jgi:DNA topoisomerase-1
VTKCGICGRDAKEDELCRYHFEALNNLRAAYEGWNTASGVSWEQYLERLVQIEETGRWVKDVIQQGGSLAEM